MNRSRPPLSRLEFLRLTSAGAAGVALGCEAPAGPLAPPEPNSQVRASDYVTLSALLEHVGHVPVELLLDPGARLPVDAPLTLPAWITLVGGGGRIGLDRHNLLVAGTPQLPPDFPAFELHAEGRVIFVSPQAVSPQNFGAIADGSTRCDPFVRAMQDAIGPVGGVVRWPTGQYLCASSIFLYGRVDWIALERQRAEILVDGYESRDGQENFLAIGVNQHERAGRRWKGVLSGFHIRPGPHYGGEPVDLNLVNVFDAQDYEISHNLFSGFASDETAIKGANQVGWLDDKQHDRLRGRYLSNRIEFGQDRRGSESISVSGLGGKNPAGRYAREITIQGNEIEGGGDDAIAVHAAEHVTIANNFCRSVDGRILVRDTEHFVIRDNHVEHLGVDGGTALIDLGLENSNAAVARPPRHGVIVGNHLYVRAGQDIPQAMFIKGAHDLVIEGNLIHNESEHVTRIRLTAQEDDGVLHPFGRITIRNNVVMGGAIGAAGPASFQDDWVVMGPNEIDGAGRFENLIRFPWNYPGTSVHLGGVANVRPDADSIVEVAGFVADAQALAVWRTPGLTVGLTDLARGSGGLGARVSDDTAFIAVALRLALSAPIPGDVRIEITEDGLVKHAVRVPGGTASTLELFTDESDEPLSRKQFRKGARVAMRVVDPAGHGSGLAIEAILRGVHMNALAGS